MAETTKPAWYEDGGREPLPTWFEDTKHHAGDGGIVETATGTLLADDGLPASGPLRAARIAAAAEAAGDAAADDGPRTVRGRAAPPPVDPAPAAPQE